MRELTDLMHDLLSPALSHRAEFVPPLSPLLASALPTFFLPPVRGRRQEEGGDVSDERTAGAGHDQGFQICGSS
jgi:hypothetical protein